MKISEIARPFAIAQVVAKKHLRIIIHFLFKIKLCTFIYAKN